ncbi:hypothetical protein FJT64_014553 [Amphibalanus amphitrite]|uniref:Reverse transcriptase domain-containing protein n=1 Tax=Amphibalanus amphitrite TaxID=1232801 RepID=A0A6A4V8J7_AMPAM|nr:hypothetical protein FJT64_014553 [Amphibalanus amphitrite]
MGAVVRYIERHHPGVRGNVYLDDFLFLSEDPTRLRSIPDVFRTLGLHINMTKSQLTPESGEDRLPGL